MPPSSKSAAFFLHVEDGAPGHAFVTLVSPEGARTTAGFWPEGDGQLQRIPNAPLGQGRVHDDSELLAKLVKGNSPLLTTKAFVISEEQYAAAKTRMEEVRAAPGSYSLLANPGTRNCTVFAIELMHLAGIPQRQVTAPQELVNPNYLPETAAKLGVPVAVGLQAKNLGDLREALGSEARLPHSPLAPSSAGPQSQAVTQQTNPPDKSSFERWADRAGPAIREAAAAAGNAVSAFAHQVEAGLGAGAAARTAHKPDAGRER